MRPIDADELKERLMAKVSGFTYKTIHIDDVVAYIDGSPTVEGESVVRCKECKWLRYCETEDLDLYLICDKPDGGGIPQSEEWFCADGEREGE